MQKRPGKRHVRKGDTVQVISGKDKGKQGKILRVLTKKNRVVVEGVNEVKRHTKPTQGSPGGIVTKNAGIHISNVLRLDDSGKPTRAARKDSKGSNPNAAKSTKKEAKAEASNKAEDKPAEDKKTAKPKKSSK